jgi:glycerol uptake facilitator-like aquaporin
MTLSRRLVAEAVGTAGLVTAVIGSGIMAERLAGGNVAIALLANTLATGAALVALILAFSAISGAHFNPVVSFVTAAAGRMRASEAVAYSLAQILGAFAGAATADLMFGEPMFSISTHARDGTGQVFSEFVATSGLVGVILGCARSQPTAIPYAVACYIVSAYWFTASTSFANPAVTLARAVSDTFAGIRPADVPAFLVAQVLGGGAAAVLFAWLLDDSTQTIDEPRAATD